MAVLVSEKAIAIKADCIFGLPYISLRQKRPTILCLLFVTLGNNDKDSFVFKIV